MPSKGQPIELGPTGQRVAANVAALRERLRLSKVELGKRLEALGRPMSLDVLTKLERGTRRVDTDDLVALALALEVNPNALLAPLADVESDVHLTPQVHGTGAVYWPWLYGDNPVLVWNTDETFQGPGEGDIPLNKAISFAAVASPLQGKRQEDVAQMIAPFLAAIRGEADGKR